MYCCDWWKTILVLWFKRHWNFSISNIGSNNELAQKRSQAIIQNNNGIVHWHMYASHSMDELICLVMGSSNWVATFYQDIPEWLLCVMAWLFCLAMIDTELSFICHHQCFKSLKHCLHLFGAGSILLMHHCGYKENAGIWDTCLRH